MKDKLNLHTRKDSRGSVGGDFRIYSDARVLVLENTMKITLE
jgi:hypothetical protein